jgi:hypothetical protein
MGLVATALTIAALAPAGAVGGVRDPASGTLDLSVVATGSDLVTATASLDGVALDEAGFGGADTGVVELRVPTTGVADGPHRLRVAVEDATGDSATLVDRTITVANAPVRQTAVVEVTVGSAGEPAAAAPACPAPELTVTLAGRSGRAHRFRGRLVCVDGGVRRPAPRGTTVAVAGRPALRVRARGRIAARLAFGRSRAIVFRAGGVAVRVARP